MSIDPKNHWEDIYKKKPSNEVSWYSPHLEKSLEIILGFHLPKEAQIIDVGGGTSTLPDDLLAEGFKNITVLDISLEALEVSKRRLEGKAQSIQWIGADITKASLPASQYDVWHDRAVFHFLTKPEDRQKYVSCMGKALKPGGYALIATFGPNGPLKCSGLEIVRYSPQTLSYELGDAFKLLESFNETHATPFGTTQNFVYCGFKK